MAQNDAMTIYFSLVGKKTGMQGEEVPGTTLGFRDWYIDIYIYIYIKCISIWWKMAYLTFKKSYFRYLWILIDENMQFWILLYENWNKLSNAIFGLGRVQGETWPNRGRSRGEKFNSDKFLIYYLLEFNFTNILSPHLSKSANK